MANIKVGVLVNTYFTLLIVNSVDDSSHIGVYVCHNHYSRTYTGSFEYENELAELKIKEK